MKALRNVLMAAMIMVIALPLSAQIGSLKNLKDKVSSGSKNTEQTSQQAVQEEPAPTQTATTAKSTVTLNAQPQEKEDIIFSKMPIDPLQPGVSVTSFMAGDPIYTVAYLDKTVQEIYDVQSTAKVMVDVFLYEIQPPLYDYQQPQEMQLSYSSYWLSGSALQNKYLVIDIAPLPDQTSAYGNPEIFYKKFGEKFDGPVIYTQDLAKLEPGDRSLKMVVRCNYQDVASGHFLLSGTDFSAYKKLSGEINMAAQNIGTQNAMMPKAKKSDPALEASMIAAIKKSNDWASGRFDATEILRLVIIDVDWTIRYHEISGAILHRYIRAAIAVKTRDGNCARYDLITFQEDYVSGKFQPLRYDGAGDKVMMDCANVNK